jgi:hypothetical protein
MMIIKSMSFAFLVDPSFHTKIPQGEARLEQDFEHVPSLCNDCIAMTT